VKEADARRRQIDVAREALAAYTGRATRLAEALRKLLPTAGPLPALVNFIDAAARDANLSAEAAFSESEAYCERVVPGTEQIRQQSALGPVEPVKPPEPRQRVFLLCNAKWREGDNTVTAGKHRVESLPLDVAKVALEHGHVLPPDHEQVRRLREFETPDYARQPEDLCIDIAQPKPSAKPKYFDRKGNVVAAAVSGV
jgi:hypothetical protein